MTEVFIEQDPLEAQLLHGNTLRQWHRILTSDDQGEPTGHLQVPCSRFGNTGDECAYFAIAAECIYVEANGANDEDDPKAGLDHYMSAAVNDREGLAELLRENYYAIPTALRPFVDFEDEGLNLAQQAALWRLSQGYKVQYQPAGFIERNDLPDGFRAGWVGPIYCGIGPDGSVSS